MFNNPRCLSDAEAGIPPLRYGQDYYTLRSIFLDGTAPPVIHMHLRLFKVATDIPIGDLSATHSASIPNGSECNYAVEVDIPLAEKGVFDEWLRQLWQEKDQFITRQLKSGLTSKPSVDIPLRLRRGREYLDAFCFFLPAAGGYVWKWLTERV